MSKELTKFRNRKKAERAIEDVYADITHALVIHYSCESFYNITDGRTPRITSIAIRNLDNGQTESFSIHKTAEIKHIAPSDIAIQYDELEKEMLAEYFDYIGRHSGFAFIHWNMRDINYGFAAIEHRYKVLGGKPEVVPDSKKLDLPRILISLYGKNYIGHGKHGRLLTLLEHNNITTKDALNGEEEALAFSNREYIKLHQSTLRKVDCMANIYLQTVDGTLKTKARWIDRYGIHPKIIIELIREHWIYGLVSFVLIIFGIIKLVQWTKVL